MKAIPAIPFFAIWLLVAAASALKRPKLQIINAGPNEVEVFWEGDDGQRVSNGKIAPGRHSIFGTKLGRRFVIVDGTRETEIVGEVPVEACRHDPTGKIGMPGFYT